MGRKVQKPKIRSFTYGRTFNNGNFENSKIEIACDVMEEDDPDEVFDVLVEMMEDCRDMERPKRNKD